MVKKNSIPERWRSLTAVGQRVPGSRFIAFKVPLKGVANQRVTQNQKFTPKDLLSTIRSLNEELGLIIDLTNTERYYTTKDLPKSVQYVKLHTAGLKIPDDATIHQFKRVVWKFLAANSDNDKLIGVHCTTGINRTGFLICRYLIDVDEWKPLHALSVFSQARGHPIEGTVYIEDILKGPPRSNAGIDTPPTIDEPRLEDDGYYGAPDGPPRDRRQREDSLRSLLELVPGNEYSDFDARGGRPLPLMRTRSDEYRDDRRDFMNRRPEVRGGRPPPADMSDDVDLRSPFDRRNIPSNMPEHLNAPERFRRPDDFNPDDRFNPRLENRRDFHSSESRPLMDVRDNFGPRDMQRPRGMPHEQMDYDERMRGRQSPVQDFYDYKEPSSHHGGAEYDDIESVRRMRSANSDVAFRERLHRQEFQSMENENHGFDPREREMTSGSLNEKILPRNTRTLEALIKDRINARNTQILGDTMNEVTHLRERPDMDGPIQGRMHPRDARILEGRMNERLNARNTQLLGEPMNESTHPRDRRDMEGAIHEGIYPRDTRTLEGRMNDRINVRNAQFLGEAMNEMMHPRERQNMEGPIHERMHPREARFMEGSVNERYNQMDAQGNRNVMDERMHLQNVRPMNERVQSRDSQFMEGRMNNRMHSSDARQIEASTHERIQARGTRFMDPPLNERYNPRDGQAMENSVNDRIPPRDSRTLNRSINERMTPRDAKSMEEPLNARMQPRMNRPVEGTMNDQIHSREGLMNERIPLRDTRAVEGRMNEQMYQRNVRTMQGSMNEKMFPRDPRAMEGSMNEKMFPRDPRAMEGSMNEKMFPRDPRAMEGSINERMYHQEAEIPMNKERAFMTNTRPFEGRKINPSEDSLRGANRFAPYPSIMKPGQPAEISRGMPRPDPRDPRTMLPSSQDATGFPLRNRFN